MKSELEVVQPGLFSSIQDVGRFGFLKYGVPHSGAMDKYASQLANVILQNSPDCAVIEITQWGPTLKFHQSAKIVITGAHLSPKINNHPVKNVVVHQMSCGDVLSFGKKQTGCRAYISVKGGFKTGEVLNSYSWYEGLTPQYKMAKGDVLFFEKDSSTAVKTFSAVKYSAEYISKKEILVYPGPEFYLLPVERKRALEDTAFTIDLSNNRMALQLVELFENQMKPILTGPVVPGTVQLTPSGKLIILMRDCQTTGGYPRVLQVSEKGLDILAQKIAGDKISFNLLQEP